MNFTFLLVILITTTIPTHSILPYFCQIFAQPDHEIPREDAVGAHLPATGSFSISLHQPKSEHFANYGSLSVRSIWCLSAPREGCLDTGFSTVSQTLLWNSNNQLASTFIPTSHLSNLPSLQMFYAQLLCGLSTRCFRRQPASASPSPPTRPVHSSLELSPMESPCVLSCTQYTIQDRAPCGASGTIYFLLTMRRRGGKGIPILKVCLTLL